MNGLDDYKNILSGGIRVVDWNYEPDTSVEGTGPVSLEIGDAILARGSGSEAHYAQFSSSYTVMIFIANQDSITGISSYNNVTMTRSDVYTSVGTSANLRYKVVKEDGDWYKYNGPYYWLVLRIA